MPAEYYTAMNPLKSGQQANAITSKASAVPTGKSQGTSFLVGRIQMGTEKRQRQRQTPLSSREERARKTQH